MTFQTFLSRIADFYGCLRFAEDKTIFLGMGDDSQGSVTAQDPYDLRGKILEPGGDAQYKSRGEIWDDHRRGPAQYRSM